MLCCIICNILYKFAKTNQGTLGETRIGETLHAASGLYGRSRQPFEGKEEQGESKDREKERETSLVCASRSGFTHDRPKGEDPGAPSFSSTTLVEPPVDAETLQSEEASAK